MNKFKNMFKSNSFISISSSVASILFGLIFGLILLIVLKPEDALYAFNQILFAGSSSSDRIGQVCYYAVPIIMTGLSVGFAFKTGLFNIGASGQYLFGAFFALYFALVIKAPWYICLLASVLGGAILGGITGVFKAFLNVNEVITSIMLNWTSLFFVNFFIANKMSMLPAGYGQSGLDRTMKIESVNPNGIIPKLGLEKVFSSHMSIAIFIAIIIAIIVYIVINKTTFGYELRACGFNKEASKYAGINEKRNIILSMVIAGALSGIGGGLYFLTGSAEYTIVKNLLSEGFNGIPVALLASSNPVGIIFSGIFISYIKVGGDYMQPEFTKEIIDIIISVIIYLSAFALLLKGVISKIINKVSSKKEDMKEEVK